MKKTHLEAAEELFAFLQGEVPKGYQCKAPQLDAEDAWTVMWYIQNQHRQFVDHIDRCDVCGDLYDSEAEGACIDGGELPYHFCEDCSWMPEYYAKKRQHLAECDGCEQCATWREDED